MLIIFGILIIAASIILGLIILIQNPKGGGLSSSFGGLGNQLMGVKQTTDVLEKGTWVFAGIVAILCLTSAVFIPKASTTNAERDRMIQEAPATLPATNRPNPTPLNTVPTQQAPQQQAPKKP